MPESYYKKWILRFFALAMFNFFVCGFNVYSFYIEVQKSTGVSNLWWLAFLISVNAITGIFMLYKVHILRKEQKQKMWDILNEPIVY